MRRWKKDYFTSALPWQQRGTPPALPITGTTHAAFTGSVSNIPLTWPRASALSNTNFTTIPLTILVMQVQRLPLKRARLLDSANLTALNTIDLASASTFNVADLRLAFQIQKWMERNALVVLGIRSSYALISALLLGMSVCSVLNT